MRGFRYSPSLSPMLAALGIVVCLALFSSIANSQASKDTDWPTYGNDPGGMRYSPLRD